MATFTQQFADVCAKAATVFGEAVTHATLADVETEIADATFAEVPTDPVEVADGQAEIHRARCTLEVADVAAPEIGETITHGENVWKIATRPLLVGGGDYWQLELTRTTAAEKTRGGHRLER